MKEITRWNDWPSDDEVQKLSDKASGLFHYAATALHWIEEQICNRGTASRKQVFEKFTQMGIGQLEDLYRVILTSFENIDNPAQDTNWRANQLQGFWHVIGTILVLDEPLTIHQIIALLANIPEDNFHVKNFLQRMRSVLIPGTTTSFEEATPQMHKSFRDYIMDGHAPAEFHILTGHAHFVTARSCLEVIVRAGSQSGVVVDYSVGQWYQHLRKAAEEGVTCEDKRMWNLFEQMVEEAVHIWKENPWRMFIGVAAAGWELLRVRTKYGGESKLVCAFPLSLVFASLTFPLLLVSSLCVLFFRHWSLPCSLSLPIVRPPVSLINTNFFWLQPYQSIWDHVLLQTWDFNQSSQPVVSSH
ncbi:hypothetical protein B0H14DRAFT_2507794 [Mycena olivaceomarginata]|nr:hypothetical protein B0H14DRAFT_2507794 [Mycena olivaceomarginata]